MFLSVHRNVDRKITKPDQGWGNPRDFVPQDETKGEVLLCDVEIRNALIGLFQAADIQTFRLERLQRFNGIVRVGPGDVRRCTQGRLFNFLSRRGGGVAAEEEMLNQNAVGSAKDWAD